MVFVLKMMKLKFAIGFFFFYFMSVDHSRSSNRMSCHLKYFESLSIENKNL